ncbi:MAG TPA: DNA polymerase II large subunit [Candidatus Paceibacterota bacterium]|nr:DNA polymerase II large subunit [Candidatus Paceibacterota bacterium]
MQTEKYFHYFEDQIKLAYEVAEQARSKGLDPVNKVEIPLAKNLAEKTVGLISTMYPQVDDPKIVKRIIELEKEYGALDLGVCLKIAEEVAKEKFCKFESLQQGIEAGIRIGFAYITLGVVSSPIEGFTGIKIKKTRDGKDYFACYYSGPIRSAGGTGATFSLMIIDHLREVFGFAKYDPTEQEIKRFVTEIFDYHERVTNLQYLPTEEESLFIASNLPIQVTGEPSEKIEVSNYKDIDRIETNILRSGACLIIAEGIAQKAPKALRVLKSLRERGFKLSDWDFLEEYCKIHEKRSKGTKNSSPTYLKDMVAGRPVFGHPARSGAFRFRYGRSRVAGFSAASVNPATMILSDNFLAIGTQLKIEKPTKGCVISVCDSIDGPIVKFKDGSVKQINNFEESKGLYKDIEEIIYLGDILFPLGDVINRNHPLIKPGYVEEWWNLELDKIGQKIKNYQNVSFDDAINLSEKFRVPIYPKFIYFWTQINHEQFLELLRWLSYARLNNKIILPYNTTEKENFKIGKRALELLGIEHEISIENVIISEITSKALFVNLGLDIDLFNKEDYFIEKEVNEIAEKAMSYLNIKSENKNVLETINFLSDFTIKDKAGEFIGTRMGRPEKAKLRKLTGSPHVLFSIGEEGGRFRSVQEACLTEGVNAEFPLFYCENCDKLTIYPKCEFCDKLTKKRSYCPICDKIFNLEKCQEHNIGQGYSKRKINITEYFNKAVKDLRLNNGDIPVLIKGIRGTSSQDHLVENLAKGFLRASFNLNVNKDGTIRYDMTELPITHFKPKEIGTSFEKLREIGYTLDIYGKELFDDDQILELMPHDIILPCSADSGDERADEVFISIAKFIDLLLERFYGLKSFYNIKKREDLVGHLAVCMAPHNCAGVISRIIGFSKTQGLLASPYMHAAMRRDCDGDEAAAMLLLDVLINFSRKYLPSHRGGTQDAPLVLNGKIVAGEVDDQILDFELVEKYPLELYELAEAGEHSSKIKIEMVKNRIKKGIDPFKNIGYTHETDDFNKGVLCSSYKQLPTMKEKVEKEMELCTKIRAVDASDVARLIIERHFIRDIRGNLRKFSMQGFRCVKCNSKFRRPPLSGVCLKCNGKIIFTISEGGIVKYLEPAIELVNNYDVPVYVKQNIEMTKKYIESIFGREETKQVDLKKWFG